MGSAESSSSDPPATPPNATATLADLSVEGERVLGRVRAGLFAADDEPVRIDRFVILRRLGSGGMGDVFLAFDPELDRRVALKVVRSDRDTPTRQDALVHEAQAVARLAHPHVVTVFEVGREDGRVWVAMEYVEGQTLRKWSTAAPRRRDEILDAYAQAGRGLVAAHAAGVVHRDFKPDNVLVGTDGRVRVVDFGLARVGGSPPTLETDGATLAGTPRYMAPELFAGAASDAASDQFAFAVALWEALAGKPPFSGSCLPEIVDAAEHQRIDPPPADAPIPRTLQRALVRALAADPARRHPDLHALLAAIEHERARPRRRRAFLGVAGSIAIGAAVVAAWPDPERCASGAERVDSVWNADRRAIVENAIAHATGDPTVGVGTVRSIDDFTTAWSSARDEVCAATVTRAELSREVLDARTTCLDRALVRAGALVDLFVEMRSDDADRELAWGAHDAVAALPRPDACLLLGRPREAVDACATDVHAQIDRATALRDAGRVGASLDPLRAAVASASACEGTQALAEAKTELATALADADDPTAEDELASAVAHGLEVDASASLARAASRLADLQGVDRGRAELGFVWSDVAIAAARRDGEDSSTLTDALQTRANLLGADMRADEAAVVAAEVLDRRRREVGPDHPSVAAAIDVLAWVEQLRGRWADALDLRRQSLALREASHPPRHPACARTHNAIGVVLGSMGRADEARAELELAIEMLEEAFGPRHRELAAPLLNLADQHARAGRPEAALPLLERAMVIAEADDNPRYLDAVLAIGAIALAENGELAASEAQWRRLVDLRTVRFGAEDVRLVQAEFGLCRVLLMQERPAEALPSCRRAATIDEAGSDPDDPAVFDTLAILVEAAAGAGEIEEARIAADRAIVRARRAAIPERRVEAIRALIQR